MGRGSNKDLNFAKLSAPFEEDDASLWYKEEEKEDEEDKNAILRSASQSSTGQTCLGWNESEVSTEMVLGRPVFHSESRLSSGFVSPPAVDSHVSSEDNESLRGTLALVPQGRLR
jgi:hypothetical protein